MTVDLNAFTEAASTEAKTAIEISTGADTDAPEPKAKPGLAL